MVDFRAMMDLIETSIVNKTKPTTSNIIYKNNEVPFIAIAVNHGFFFTKTVYTFELNKKLLKETDIILCIRKNIYNKNYELIFSYNDTFRTFVFKYEHSYKKLFRKLKRYSKSYKIVKINYPYLFNS